MTHGSLTHDTYPNAPTGVTICLIGVCAVLVTGVVAAGVTRQRLFSHNTLR
jgi:hypothetical protein